MQLVDMKNRIFVIILMIHVLYYLSYYNYFNLHVSYYSKNVQNLSDLKTLMQWNSNFENPCSAIAPRCDLLPKSIPS